MIFMLRELLPDFRHYSWEKEYKIYKNAQVNCIELKIYMRSLVKDATEKEFSLYKCVRKQLG